MKTVVKLSLVIGLISTVAIFSAEAQRGPGKGPGHGQGYGPDSCRVQLMVDDLVKEIDLTEQQEQQILQIHYDHIEKMKALRAEYRNDCVGDREAHIAAREEMDAQVKKILKANQVEQYEKFMEQRRGPHGGKHQHWK